MLLRFLIEFVLVSSSLSILEFEKFTTVYLHMTKQDV